MSSTRGAGEVDTEEARESRTAQFVHDFARVDLPLPAVVRAIDLVATPMLLEQFVTHAWDDEVRVIEAVHAEPVHRGGAHVDVKFGLQRSRNDAVILPVSWRSRSGPWVPPLDADLEFAAFGPHRTHIHLYGCSELPPGAAAGTQSASLAQRLTVAVVRHVLNLLTGRIFAVASGDFTAPRRP